MKISGGGKTCSNSFLPFSKSTDQNRYCSLACLAEQRKQINNNGLKTAQSKGHRGSEAIDWSKDNNSNDNETVNIDICSSCIIATMKAATPQQSREPARGAVQFEISWLDGEGLASKKSTLSLLLLFLLSYQL